MKRAPSVLIAVLIIVAVWYGLNLSAPYPPWALSDPGVIVVGMQGGICKVQSVSGDITTRWGYDVTWEIRGRCDPRYAVRIANVRQQDSNPAPAAEGQTLTVPMGLFEFDVEILDSENQGRTVPGAGGKGTLMVCPDWPCRKAAAYERRGVIDGPTPPPSPATSSTPSPFAAATPSTAVSPTPASAPTPRP